MSPVLLSSLCRGQGLSAFHTRQMIHGARLKPDCVKRNLALVPLPHHAEQHCHSLGDQLVLTRVLFLLGRLGKGWRLRDWSQS